MPPMIISRQLHHCCVKSIYSGGLISLSISRRSSDRRAMMLQRQARRRAASSSALRAVSRRPASMAVALPSTTRAGRVTHIISARFTTIPALSSSTVCRPLYYWPNRRRHLLLHSSAALRRRFHRNMKCDIKENLSIYS